MKILVPTDGSALSLAVLPHVEMIARHIGATVILLRVGRLPSGYSSPRYRPATEDVTIVFPETPVDVDMAKHPVYQTQAMESAAAEMRASLAGAEERLRAQGIEVRTEVLFGKPAEEILAYVDREGIDILAMVTRGRRGLDQLIRGSVARQVLQKLTIPVLLLRVTGETETTEEPEPFAEL